jgi:hypothetical protein
MFTPKKKSRMMVPGNNSSQAAHAEDREEGERQRREADDLAHFTEDSWRPA